MSEPKTPDDHVYLQGLALRFYRGIGEETEYIAPFSKLNFFVGPNNSGKSIVLNFLAEFLPLENNHRECPIFWQAIMLAIEGEHLKTSGFHGLWTRWKELLVWCS
jgi:predicted ATP-dependent endonuclease of OLD family